MISGSMDFGTPMMPRISSSQSRVSRFMSMVRLALVTSVTCSPVRFQMSQVSMVPNRISPASARRRSDGSASSSQRIFGPEK